MATNQSRFCDDNVKLRRISAYAIRSMRNGSRESPIAGAQIS